MEQFRSKHKQTQSDIQITVIQIFLDNLIHFE